MYAGATFEDAEDAVSEAMARAYTCWPELTQPAAWLRTVALRLYFKKAEKDRRQGHAETTASALDCLDRVSAGPQEERAVHSQVIAVLQCLPHAQRTAMALTFDGYTPAEIAALLQQKSAATVRSNLRHARMRLQGKFGESGGRTDGR
jgi:RNA polymerase sigma-70 factor (ECF subfamily)